MADDSSAGTGGLLVVLGIVVALVIGFVLWNQGMIGGHEPDTNINVELPTPSAPNP